jgi:methyltransferase (TIGR00027 family)
MHEAIPSRTALRVALRRAAHQLYDPPPLVFEDPLAVRILAGNQGERGPYIQELRKTSTRLEALHSIALRAFLVARSRYAEDTLAHAVQTTGLSQYVLLGAGLDTFAHRNPYPNLRVYEVDHPATQAWKLALLAQANLPIPPSLTHTPVDFERESLAERLQASGFDPTRTTLFAWLGVVPYLTLPAFRATVAFIAAQPPGSGVVFDYAQPRAVLPPLEQLAHDSLAARVALAGEPFQLYFTPAEVARELSRFSHIEDLGRDQLNPRYFPPRAGTPQPQLQLLSTSGRLLSAWL